MNEQDPAAASRDKSRPNISVTESGRRLVHEQRHMAETGDWDSVEVGSRVVGTPGAPEPLEGRLDPDASLRIASVVPPPDSQNAPLVDPVLALVGAVIDDRYTVESVLGQGGMGVVYQCRHTIIGKKVAMKVLRQDMARDAELTKRFLNEARAASAIGNPHIIDISDFGRLPDGSTYFVMEFLDGEPLTELTVGEKPVPLVRLLHIARQLAEGLSAAHRADIVHRDLKPDNVMLVTRGSERDFVKILDFGIAKVSGGEGKLTRAGAVFGTPHYMSPEQASGNAVDQRGDVYSLGVMLHEMACGKVPFDADNFMGILTQHLYKAPAPLNSVMPESTGVPPAFEAIVLKCMDKDPAERYQSMDELLADLDALEMGRMPSAMPGIVPRGAAPPEYYRAAAPSVVTELPRGQSLFPRTPTWALYAIVGAISLVVALVVALAIDGRASSKRAAKPKPQAAQQVVVASAPAPTSVQVSLAVAPLEAHIFQGDVDLGTSPVLIEIPQGKPVTLSVRQEGYVTQEVVLDGSEVRRSIALEKVPARSGPVARPKPAGAAAPAGVRPRRPSSTGGEVLEPW